jgi:hypothetical protein
MAHLGNRSVHTNWASTNWLEEQGIHRVRHPPYSPDRAPNDFYLFPSVKEKFERI